MLVLPIENPRESNPYPFYIKNIGQSDGYQDEDLNLVPVWDCGINGQKIEIGLFSSECLTHDKAQNHIKSKFENFTQMEPHIQGMKNIILSTMSNQSTLNYPTDDTITCNNIPSNFSDAIDNITSYLQNEQSKLKNINLFHISKSHPQNQIQVDPYNDALQSSFGSNFVHGRNGLGWINLITPSSSKYGFSDFNYRSLTQMRFSLNVAATTNRGDRAFYSPISANILFNVPSTDTSIDYGSKITVNEFMSNMMQNGNESDVRKMDAAYSIAAGALSNILEIDQFLSWRELQFIISLSSTVNDANHSSWITNAAGVKYSNHYGFGRLNVANAVNFAKTFPGLPSELFLESENIYEDPVIPSCRGSPLNFSHTITKKIKVVENVFLIIETTHAKIGDIIIELISPSGTRVVVNNIADTQPINDEMGVYGFNVRAFLGENGIGTWNIIIYSTGCIPMGRVHRTKLQVFGCDSINDILNVQKRLIRTSSKNTEIDSQPIRPSHSNLYKESQSCSLSIKNFHANSVLNSSDYISFQLSSINGLKNQPAVLYYSIESDNPLKTLLGFKQFESAGQINNFKMLPPHNLAGKANITFHVNIINVTKGIDSCSCGPFSITSLNYSSHQYIKLDKNMNYSIPYFTDSYESSLALFTLVNYETKEMIFRFSDHNSGYIDIKIDETQNISKGILSVQVLSAFPQNPCSLLIQSFYISKISSHDDFSNFTFNESICPIIPGLNYKQNDAAITKPLPTITQTLAPSPTNSITKNKDSSDSNSANIKSIVITVSSIFSVVTVFTAVGVTVIVIKIHRDHERAPNQYKDDIEEPAINL